MTIIRAIPEPGQLVRLRQRQYVVTDVRQSIAQIRISSAGLQKSQHVVSLASIEDDAMGEELQTIWELEPGAHVYERVELPQPNGFDAPERLLSGAKTTTSATDASALASASMPGAR